MSTTNGDSCVSLMQGTLLRPVARYPGSVATDQALKIAANRVQTTLRGNIGSGDTIITVGDASRLVPDMLLSIDSEIISITSISGNYLTVVRGFDGTFASSHASGSTLSSNIVAWHHNALSEEIKAIENALGPNLANIPGSAVDSGSIVSSKYDFAGQQPGGNLIVGLNVVTLTPVPIGVNGANQYHYLYVSGGTGAAEACLISGGTALSGAATGTVFITCANAHSGAWSIRSATAGIQEAVYSVGTSGSRVNVRIPPADSLTYAPVTVKGDDVCIFGYGQASVVKPQFTAGRVFWFNNLGNSGAPRAGWRNTINNLNINGPGGTNTVVAIEIRGQLAFRAIDVGVADTFRGIYLYDNGGTSSAVWIRHCVLAGFVPGTGIAFEQNGGADVFLVNNHIVNDAASSALAGILLTNTLGTKVFYNEVYGFKYGMLMRPGSGDHVAAINSAGNWYDSCENDAFRLEPTGTGVISEIASVNDRMATCRGNGIALVGNATNILGILFSEDLSVFNQGSGVTYLGGQDVEFANCHVCGNSSAAPGTYHGFYAGPGASGFRIHGGTYGQAFALPGGTPPNSQQYGILIDTGAGDNIVIDGAVVHPNINGGLVDGSTGQNKIIRNLLSYQASLATASVAAGTINLGNEPYECAVVSGTATVTSIVPAYPGRRVKLVKTDGGTITFATGGNIHNVGRTLAGTDGIIIAEFVSTKWVLIGP